MPVACSIRDYRDSDWEAICRVHDRSRPDELRGSYDPRAFVPLAEDPEAEDIHDCQLFVAIVEGEVVAFAGIDDPYLAWLYVDPAHYRQGIGRALLRHCLRRVGAEGWTVACANNQPALALYRAEGFVEAERFTGTNAGYSGPGVILALHPALRSWKQPRCSGGGA